MCEMSQVGSKPSLFLGDALAKARIRFLELRTLITHISDFVNLLARLSNRRRRLELRRNWVCRRPSFAGSLRSVERASNYGSFAAMNPGEIAVWA
jgi:hypothetical protein